MKRPGLVASILLSLAFFQSPRNLLVNAADVVQTRQVLQSTPTGNHRLEYLLYLPPGYDAKSDQEWPLVIFLHGAGERGSDLWKVAVHGPPKHVQQGKSFPFILVSPQCPEGSNWDDQPVMALLSEISKRHKVDAKRVYLTGLSMGGYGTWSLISRYPDRFAAAAPICGGGSTLDVKLAEGSKLAALRSLPVWAFHGIKDKVVSVDESRKMVEQFKQKGCKEIKLTEYPEAGHDSWTVTYSNPEFYDWLLSKKRE